MPNGAGKYDNLCTKVREEVDAKGALVIIIDGNKGNGFSAQLPPESAQGIPSMLRTVADQIEEANNQRSLN